MTYQWSKNGTAVSGGTSSTYTTPATATSDGGTQFTVIVSNSVKSVTSSAATLTVNAAPVTITVNPNNSTLTVGSTQQFVGNVSGTSNTAVTWTVSGAGCTGAGCGTISVNGLYIPPTSVPSPATVTVMATSVADPTKSASASVTIVAAVAVLLSISPTSTSVPTSGTQLFTASVTGTSNTAVSWSVSGAGCGGSSCGTISTSASSAVYLAPTVPPSPPSVAVNVTSVADPTKSVSAQLTIVTVTAPPPPPTQQFYVSPSGNDSDSGTSTSTPWQTIQKAMNSATAGSTVNIMAGTYQEELTMNVSGTSGNYITFQPYNFSVPAGGCGGYTGVACGGDQVILDYTYLGTNTSQTPLFEIGGKSFIRVQGLTLQNWTSSGSLQRGLIIKNGAAYIEFDYNKFLNFKNIGPFDGTAWECPIRIGEGSAANNITFIGNELGNLVTLYSEALTFDGSSVTNGLAQDNYIHDTDGNGLTTYNGANNITFRHNKLEYISVKRDGTVWYNMTRDGIYIDGGYSELIERNFLNEAGVGIEALSEPGQINTHDVIIRNNVVENSPAGIVIGTWYSDTDGSSVYNISVWNNIIYANTDGVVIRPMTSASVSWENNIFANNGTTYVNSLNWNPGTVGYNVYFGGGSGPGSNNLTSDPLFVSASTGNFSLQSTSPAINAGDPLSSTTIVGTVDFVGNPRILGGRIDIGAYEVQ
jgi:hypothetical protein